MGKRRAAAFFAALFLTVPALRGVELDAVAVNPAVARAAEYDRLIREGLRALYYLDYASARARFQELTDEFPESPMGAYATATAVWWELTNEFDEKNPALEKEFLDAAGKSAQAARAALKKGDPTGEASLCLGGALGLQARWEAINGQWLSAYRHGRQAFKDQKKAIEINPQMYDAYLGVGIFHYYTATLPAVVKVLAKLIFGGNKQEGLSEIQTAMEKARFSRTAARLFLVGIYINNEKDPRRALALVREGRQEFSGSPFFQLLEMLTLEETHDWDDLERESRDFLARIDRKEPFYSPAYAHRGLFSLGNSFLGRGRPAEAMEIYNRILKEFPSEDRWVTMTYLNRGRAHDRLGERDLALADYNAVLKRRDVWELHEKAEKYIETADRP